MPAAIPIAIGVAGAAGSIGSAAIQSSGAHNAANAQAQAAQQGVNTIQQGTQNATSAINQIYGGAQAGLQPYQNAGLYGLNTIVNQLQNPDVTQPGQVTANGIGTQYGQAFQAPTAYQAAQTPGYQFLQETGQNALLNNAAALGNLRSGSTAKGLLNYSQGLASTNYQNAFNNALQTYGTNYGVFQNNLQNLRGNLGSLAAGGQQAASTLGGLAAGQAGQIAGVTTGGAQSIADLLGQKGAATASGYVGGANAWANGLGGAGNAVTQGLLLSSLGKPSGSNVRPSSVFGSF